jgi:hypothetical protein
MPANHTAAGLQVKIDMSIYDEYQIVITEAQRRSIVRALTNALANDRRSSDLTHPTPTEWMQHSALQHDRTVRAKSDAMTLPSLLDC